jgi:hypothetical protein
MSSKDASARSTPILRADNGSLPMVAYRMPPALAVRVYSKSSLIAAGMASLVAPEGAGNGGPRPNAEVTTVALG